MRACVGFLDLRRGLVFLLELPEDGVVPDQGVKCQPPERKKAVGLKTRRTSVGRLCRRLYVHPLVAGLAFERTVIVIIGYRNRAVATVAGWWSGLGDRERVVREVLRVDGSGVVVAGETEVERDLNVGGELFLEQGEEIVVCDLGNGHWCLRDVPEGH